MPPQINNNKPNTAVYEIYFQPARHLLFACNNFLSNDDLMHRQKIGNKNTFGRLIEKLFKWNDDG